MTAIAVSQIRFRLASYRLGIVRVEVHRVRKVSSLIVHAASFSRRPLSRLVVVDIDCILHPFSMLMMGTVRSAIGNFFLELDPIVSALIAFGTSIDNDLAGR